MAEQARRLASQTYPLRAAARITGLSPALLRAWERRYGAVEPRRTPGGTRRYSAEDLERLRWLKAAVAAGNRISTLAECDIEELKRRATVDDEKSDDGLQEALHAISRLDAPDVQRIISQKFSLLGPARFAREFAMPLAQQIGQRWSESRMSIASEHLATGVLRSVLGSALQPSARSMQGPCVVFATPAGEPHELGLQMVALTALGAGASPVYLGADLPVDALADAAVQTGAAAVALSIITLPEKLAIDEVSSLREAISERVQLWVGGSCAHRIVAIDGVDFIATLDELERRIVLMGYGSEESA